MGTTHLHELQSNGNALAFAKSLVVMATEMLWHAKEIHQKLHIMSVPLEWDKWESYLDEVKLVLPDIYGPTQIRDGTASEHRLMFDIEQLLSLHSLIHKTILVSWSAVLKSLSLCCLKM